MTKEEEPSDNPKVGKQVAVLFKLGAIDDSVAQGYYKTGEDHIPITVSPKVVRSDPVPIIRALLLELRERRMRSRYPRLSEAEYRARRAYPETADIADFSIRQIIKEGDGWWFHGRSKSGVIVWNMGPYATETEAENVADDWDHRSWNQ